MARATNDGLDVPAWVLKGWIVHCDRGGYRKRECEGESVGRGMLSEDFDEEIEGGQAKFDGVVGSSDRKKTLEKKPPPPI